MKRFLCMLILIPSLILAIPAVISFLVPEPDFVPVSNSYSFPASITILDAETSQIHTIATEDCVNRIFLSDLLPGAPFEAAKAQAVATRSYLLSIIEKQLHNDCMLCNDPSHCMGISLNDIPAAMHPAVAETVGQILLYGEKPAKACYFTACSGKTESAEDVWGVDIPYLRSVSSEGDSRSASYRSRVFYPIDGFYTVLKGARHNIDISQSNLGKVEKTKAGHVKEMVLLNQRFTGEEIKNLFQLKSTNFTAEVLDNQIVFTVLGDGHGVGMSQYGAKTMAENGKNYADILSHYYSDVQLKSAIKET